MSDTGKTIALIKALGGGGGALPPITDADNGKVLTANSGVWGAQEPIGKKFIVTLTPTAQDYSGTMDKTVAEIDAAYKAGRQVVFAIAAGTDSYTFDCTMRYFNGDVYPSYNAYTVLNGNLVMAFTGATNHGDTATYATSIFPLTPAT